MESQSLSAASDDHSWSSTTRAQQALYVSSQRSAPAGRAEHTSSGDSWSSVSHQHLAQASSRGARTSRCRQEAMQSRLYRAGLAAGVTTTEPLHTPFISRTTPRSCSTRPEQRGKWSTTGRPIPAPHVHKFEAERHHRTDTVRTDSDRDCTILRLDV